MEGATRPEAIVEAIRNDGGVTIEWQTGQRPTHGYAVAPSESTERTIPLTKLTPEVLTDYAEAFRALLALPGMCLGARDKEGVVYLDVSIVVADRAVAAALAQDAHQFAIRCLHEGRSLAMETVSRDERETIEAARAGTAYRQLRQQIEAAIAGRDQSSDSLT